LFGRRQGIPGAADGSDSDGGPELGAELSVFPLTVIVQKIAAESAETLGTNPDSFGRDLPGREAAWSKVKL